MMGEYMGPLSIFVPIALVMSLLVAYKLTPFLADTLLKVEDKKQKNKKGVFEHLANFYGKVLRIILSKKRNQIILLLTTFILLIVVFIFPVLRLVHFRMLPAADRDQFYVYLDAPEGTNYPRTKEIADDVTQLLLAHKETRSVQNFTARAPVLDFNGLYRSANLRSQPFLATLRVNLTPKEARDQTSEQIVQTIRSQIRANQKLVNLWQEGVRIRLVEDPPGPPVQATLQAKIKGPQDEIRSLITEKVVSAFAQTQEVVDIYTTEEASFPRLVYSVNHQKALELGVSTAQIASALNSALSPVKVDQFHLPEQNEFVFIELQFAKDARASILDLEKVQIKNQLGEMLPLSSVVIREDSRNVPVRYRDEQINTNYVNAEMGKRSVVYAVIDLIKELHGQDLSPEIQFKDWNLFALRYEDQNGDQYLIEWGGEWKMTLENFRDLSLAMLVAFVLIYAVLVGQFRSFTAPALIMTTIPLGFLGILPGFAILDALNGTFLTATSLIGFIALMGIVVNNAILYLEYFDQLQSRGLDRKTALIEAGQTRLRPILLTSMTTILGTLTIASDPVWSGLAWSIVFGLSLSVIFTLIVFPTLYNLIKPKR
jgi:multidrug efflux pump subunit AcrB